MTAGATEGTAFFCAMRLPGATHNDLAIRARRRADGTVGRFVARGEGAIAAASAYESRFAAHAPQQPFAGPLSVGLAFVWSRFGEDGAEIHADGEPKDTPPDADNMAKTALDALAACGFFGRGDQQAARLVVTKSWGDVEGVYVEVAPIVGW